jgi:hypothetical protein
MSNEKLPSRPSHKQQIVPTTFGISLTDVTISQRAFAIVVDKKVVCHGLAFCRDRIFHRAFLLRAHAGKRLFVLFMVTWIGRRDEFAKKYLPFRFGGLWDGIEVHLRPCHKTVRVQHLH